jgi:hypothetical protein
VFSVRFRRALGWPLAVAAALAPAVAGHAQSTPADDAGAGWMLGLGAQADEHEASSLLGTMQVGVGSRTWLTFVAGRSSSPSDRADIEANALVIGVDHRLDKVGFTFEAERWGDSGALETKDFSGSVYFDRERWRLGFGYERRNIEIPFTVTGPLGGTFVRTADVPADGFSVNGNVALARRWRLYFGLTEYDYERNLNVVPRIASLNMLSTSTLTLANSFLDHDRWIALERAFGQATLLNFRVATDRSAIDASELDTFEAAVLFPIGRRVDLEVSLGSGRSEFFDAGLYGGLLFLIYGR